MDIKKYLMDLYIEKYGEHINKEIAMNLVEEMAVTDGSGRPTGEKWSYQESKDVGMKNGINFAQVDSYEWYVVLNMMYSDYYRTAKKHGFNDSTFFAELASDWFSDVDAKENKTFCYFM